MIINDAIENLIVAQAGLVDYHNQNFVDACKLGIEALRTVRLCRVNQWIPLKMINPGVAMEGETKS